MKMLRIRTHLAVLVLALVAAFALPIAFAHGATRKPVVHKTDAFPLHHGLKAKSSSRGPRVALLQFLIRDPRPKANPWKHIKGTLKPCDKGRHKSCYKGVYDLPTAKGVIAWKFRVGAPSRGQCGYKVDLWRQTKITPFFWHLLTTGKGRPYCWVAVAAKRLAAAEDAETPLAKKLADYEFAQIRTGHFYETCGGHCNRGYYIDQMQRFFGLIGQPWCAIEQNFSRHAIGQPSLPAAYGNPQFVPNIITAGMWHLGGSSLQAIARPGEWVLYYHDISHIGYVVKIDKDSHGKPTGYYWTIEGNWNDRLAEVHHSPYDHLHYFFVDPKFVKVKK